MRGEVGLYSSQRRTVTPAATSTCSKFSLWRRPPLSAGTGTGLAPEDLRTPWLPGTGSWSPLGLCMALPPFCRHGRSASPLGALGATVLLALACQLLDPAWECRGSPKWLHMRFQAARDRWHLWSCEPEAPKPVMGAVGGPRTPSTEMPSAVQEIAELASADFLRRLRDGGPQAERSEDLPVVNASWVAKDAHETARNAGAPQPGSQGEAIKKDS
eukprot:s3332_g1.t1